MDFPFTQPPGSVGKIVWNGSKFLDSSGNQSEVLCYTQATSNWSDDLTSLHEQEAGQHHPIDIASRELAMQSLKKYCRTGQPVVLETGCSSGFFLEHLVREMPRSIVIGADYIAAPLQKLAKRLQGVPLLQFDLRTCPLPDASVDAVVCLNVLEHIDDHAKALTEIFRILKPGGIAHIEVPAGPKLYDVYDELLLHHRRYRMSDLLQLTKKAGFRTLRATHLGFFVFPAFALKKWSNKRALKLAPEEKKRMVSTQIRNSSNSGILRLLLRSETALGSFISFPWGIRCVAVVGKPA